jgi:hypothetical protein
MTHSSNEFHGIMTTPAQGMADGDSDHDAVT